MTIHTAAALAQLQSLDLDAKIILTRKRIRAWYEHFDGAVYVAFSGGKDSTALAYLVLDMYPDVPLVFSDTGLEFPEIRDFVKRFIGTTWVKPEKSFRRVIAEDGYPLVSKTVADAIDKIRRLGPDSATGHFYLTGYRRDGVYVPRAVLAQKWRGLIDSPWLISPKCCDRLKKAPLHAYQKATGRLPITGEMASESRSRELQWQRHGCNMVAARSPKSTPMAFWSEQDVWDFITAWGLPTAEPYAMGYTRTGCIFCAFGAHLEKYPNRFQLLYDTHPKLWDYCMRPWDQGGLGMAEPLAFTGVDIKPVRQTP